MSAYHQVEFASPGTFMSESTTKRIDSWDVSKAVEMSRQITERHNARPFGFRFQTYTLDANHNKKVVDQSGMYYLGGKVLTYHDVERRQDPRDDILLSNMRCNNYTHVIEVTNGWKSTLPFNPAKDRVV